YQDGMVRYYGPRGVRCTDSSNTRCVSSVHVRKIGPSHPTQLPAVDVSPSASNNTTAPLGVTRTQASGPHGGDALCSPIRPMYVSLVPKSCPSGSSSATGSLLSSTTRPTRSSVTRNSPLTRTCPRSSSSRRLPSAWVQTARPNANGAPPSTQDGGGVAAHPTALAAIAPANPPWANQRNWTAMGGFS